MLFTLRRAQTISEVAPLFLNPSIWPYVTDDENRPEQLQGDASLPPNMIYLLAMDGEKAAGMFAFTRRNAATCEMHAALLPRARGRKQGSDELFQLALKWLWENTKFHRIFAGIPAYNRLAIAYAKRNGMQHFATEPSSWLKDGKLHNTELFGINREN